MIKNIKGSREPEMASDIPKHVTCTIQPLLAYPWKYGSSETNIIGQWAEDGSGYIIVCPEQLRSCIVEMQNRLYWQQQEIEKQQDVLRKAQDKAGSFLA